MKLFNRDLEREVVVVAEIGNNHEGDVHLAKDMILSAAETGVDAVKFQSFRTEYYVSRRETERFARLKKFELKEEDFAELKKTAENAGLHFLCTPFDLHSAEFLCGLCDVVKISSGDNTFYPLLEYVALQGKQMIISCGLATTEELRLLKESLDAVWKRIEKKPGVVLLHCVSSYPVPPEDANISAITSLKREFGGDVGYSDHTIGFDAACLAVACGACLIEKHFTLDKNQSDFRDHQLSADPAEMKELVRKARLAKILLGDGTLGVRSSEKKNAVTSRRSVVAARDLPKGTRLEWGHISWVRPGGGIPPGLEGKVLGKRLRHSVEQGDPILEEMVE